MGADEGYTQLKVQQYLDDVSRLNIPAEQTQWYNVDVANMLADTRIKGHEVDETSLIITSFPRTQRYVVLPRVRKDAPFPQAFVALFCR